MLQTDEVVKHKNLIAAHKISAFFEEAFHIY